ncbi:hypothetical protein M0638_25995 [Roseomonas sp. NAR14]|uniref:Uncharacterized protein n=1 Tax=Roseomonas acroporae TaxID=2937791 RepID=A0A9X2BWH9_9PROT|nr:hypothetical protein [Roseomonas acroporae]MCK8787813.1 hypothetical protein [Roseomonas acroporae]
MRRLLIIMLVAAGLGLGAAVVWQQDHRTLSAEVEGQIKAGIERAALIGFRATAAVRCGHRDMRWFDLVGTAAVNEFDGVAAQAGGQSVRVYERLKGAMTASWQIAEEVFPLPNRDEARCAAFVTADELARLDALAERTSGSR